VRLLLSFFLLYFAQPLTAGNDYKPCGMRFSALGKTAGAPGETFRLIGEWGNEQGKKIPVINRGGSHRLKVVSWKDKYILVKVPAHLEPGKYKVGVYCSDLSKGVSYSSGFKNFEVERVPESFADLLKAYWKKYVVDLRKYKHWAIIAAAFIVALHLRRRNSKANAARRTERRD